MSDVRLILDGNTDHLAHAEMEYFFTEEKNPICDCSRSNALNTSDNRDCILFAHLFLSDHLI